VDVYLRHFPLPQSRYCDLPAISKGLGENQGGDYRHSRRRSPPRELILSLLEQGTFGTHDSRVGHTDTRRSRLICVHYRYS
jgi:hypothetical protein